MIVIKLKWLWRTNNLDQLCSFILQHWKVKHSWSPCRWHFLSSTLRKDYSKKNMKIRTHHTTKKKTWHISKPCQQWHKFLCLCLEPSIIHLHRYSTVMKSVVNWWIQNFINAMVRKFRMFLEKHIIDKHRKSSSVCKSNVSIWW